MSMDIDENDNLPPIFENSEIDSSSTSRMDVETTTKSNGSEISFILCPMCQTPIAPNPSNLCVKCLNSQVDVSEGITKQLVVFQCRQCERYFKNPQYIEAQLESPQLLELCLKKIRGLGKVNLIDAKFLWTEPHSRRLRVELTIQKEVFNGAIVQKKFPVEYILENQQCTECQASFTHHLWRACVQVRQKVTHKRTFLYLEQILLKHGMTGQCLGITEQRDGIDFFFSSRSHAQAFLAFLHSVVPVEAKQSKRLVSHDTKSNIAKYKYTFFAEIAPVCRGDLVIIPSKARTKLGGRSPIVLAFKVTSALYLIDPTSLHVIEFNASQYFTHHFESIANSKDFTLFFVMAVKHLNVKHNKFQLAEVELVRESELEADNALVLETVTHLGGVIKEGDTVCGYDLQRLSNVRDFLGTNSEFVKYTRKMKLPDVIIVKKHYDRSGRHARKRKWKLKTIEKEKAYELDKHTQQKEEEDAEEFMRELEEDFEMRMKINIYKDREKLERIARGGDDAASIATSEGREDVPKIPMGELLDDLADLKLEDIKNPNYEKMLDHDKDKDKDVKDID